MRSPMVGALPIRGPVAGRGHSLSCFGRGVVGWVTRTHAGYLLEGLNLKVCPRGLSPPLSALGDFCRVISSHAIENDPLYSFTSWLKTPPMFTCAGALKKISECAPQSQIVVLNRMLM